MVVITLIVFVVLASMTIGGVAYRNVTRVRKGEAHEFAPTDALEFTVNHWSGKVTAPIQAYPGFVTLNPLRNKSGPEGIEVQGHFLNPQAYCRLTAQPIAECKCDRHRSVRS